MTYYYSLKISIFMTAEKFIKISSILEHLVLIMLYKLWVVSCVAARADHRVHLRAMVVLCVAARADHRVHLRAMLVLCVAARADHRVHLRAMLVLCVAARANHRVHLRAPCKRRGSDREGRPVHAGRRHQTHQRIRRTDLPHWLRARRPSPWEQ